MLEGYEGTLLKLDIYSLKHRLLQVARLTGLAFTHAHTHTHTHLCCAELSLENYLCFASLKKKGT